MVDGPSTTEGQPLQFTLQLSKPSDRDVVVRAAIAGGTATGGQDYPDIPAMEGNVQPGETSGLMLLEMFDDAVDEPDETLILRPAASAARYVGPETLIGTIVDND